MDMQSQTTRPYAHDQAEDPSRIHHPEEEEHQEKGTSKMFRKVKEKAKKIKNNFTKHDHGHEHDDDVDEEDDEYDEQDPDVHGAPVYESSAVRSGVTGQPESLSHLGEAKVPAPEEIIPPGTKAFPVVSSAVRSGVTGQPESRSHLGEAKVPAPEEIIPGTKAFPVVSSDYTRPVEPVQLRDASYGHEAPKRLDEDAAPPGGGSGYLSGASNYQSKVTDPTHEGGETGVPGIAESLGRMKVTDESPDQKSGLGFGRDLPTRGYDEFAPKEESGIGKDSPAGFREESRAELGKDFPTRSHDVFDQKNESLDENSPMGYGGKSGAGLGGDFPTRSHGFGVKNESGRPTGFGRGVGEDLPAGSRDFGLKTESGIQKDSSKGIGGELGTGIGEDFPARSHELGPKNESGIGKDSRRGVGEDLPAGSRDFGLKTESGIQKDSSKGIGGELGTGIGEDFPARSHELGPKNESGIGKDSRPYGEDAEAGLEKNVPARSDDVEVKTGLGSDLPTGTHDQFAPELSRPKVEETQEPKPSTYTEKFTSATSAISDTAIAMKNAVSSRLGYSGETADTVSDQQHERPVGGEIPRSATGYGQNVAGTVAEKLSPVSEKVKETGSNVMTKLPISGGGSGAEAEEKSVSTRDYLTEKLRPGKEDKALSEMIAEKLHLGGGGDGEKKSTTTKEVEVTVEKIPSDQISVERDSRGAFAEEREGAAAGGGMVGKIKGAVNSWLGGATEEVKSKSSSSGEESSQSLGSTVGTKGFSDSGGARGLQQSGH